ncbi:MAG TPA: sigma-70 family RNA polymerase sigma factor [Chryseolinea sp.]|nr:sigma-70 family RNA polymerase sigma factor [Chryseolinea sp.]
MNQEEIIFKIRSGGQSELGAIYEEFREEFLHWIMREYHCSSDDSQDIYQLTILIFYDNIRQGKLQHLVSSVKTYLFGIGKNIAKENLRKEKRFVPIGQEKWLKNYLIDEPSQQVDESAFAKARTALEKLGQPCQRLIELFYYEKKSMPEITDALGYKNPETAKNQKCKCMARLRKIFEQETTTTSMIITS